MTRPSFRTFKRNALDEDGASRGNDLEDPSEAPEPGGAFTAREVAGFLGRRVTAREGLLVPAGSRGTITDSRRYAGGWLIHISWDGLGADTGDWLTKREAVQSLTWH